MTANMSKQLLSRLKKVAREWPVDPSRQGRDLGEYLRTVYHKKFESLVEKDVSNFSWYRRHGTMIHRTKASVLNQGLRTHPTASLQTSYYICPDILHTCILCTTTTLHSKVMPGGRVLQPY